MSRLVLAAALGLCASVAHAGDKPLIAPPPAWVRVAEPSGVLPPPDSAAVRALLFDEQVQFGPRGETIYLETRSRLQSAQGLSAMGNIVLPWKPDTGDITIHKVHILRDGKVIDVLAKQSFTVLRRENNLELSMLDGVLTATLQPEGLQVGDVLDVAFSVSSSDPVVRGKAEKNFSGLASLPIDHMRLRAVWPNSKSVRARITDGFPTAQPVRGGDTTEFQIDLHDVQPLILPSGAPLRFQLLRQAELSEFASWAEVSTLFAPLYARASELKPGSPLKAEAARIRAASADPKVQAAMALDLVQDQVRYVFLGMNDGGLVPAPADLTWTRRFGDCKGKTVLLLALLKELGIEAQPSLISTERGDGLDERLPSVGVFDHVLVRAKLGGRDYWLDGTRIGDRNIDAIRVPPFRWTLPVQSAGGALVRLAQSPLEVPDTAVLLRLDASAGLDAPAPAHAEVVFRGDEGTVMNQRVGNLPPGDVNRVMRGFWSKLYDFVDVATASAAFDPKTGEEKLSMDGVAKITWRATAGGRRFEVGSAELRGASADFHRDPGLHADAPFNVPFPYFIRNVTSIVLPRGGEGFAIDGGDLDVKAAGFQLKRTSRIENGVVNVDYSVRTLAPEFPAAEAPAAAAALREASRSGVFIRAPLGFRSSENTVSATPAPDPASVAEVVNRAGKLIEARSYDKAIADLDQAIALDPNSALAYADRGIARYWKGDMVGAKADFDAAARLDPRSPVAQHGYGLLAERDGRYADAVAAFTRAVDLKPSNAFGLTHRAFDEWRLGRADGALADSDEALKLAPGAIELRILRADILHARREDAKALAEIDQGLSQSPNDEALPLTRAVFLATLGRRTEAMAAFAVAIAAKPTAAAYLSRAVNRDPADWAGRLGDIDAAEKLAPKAPSVLVMRADVEADAGDIGRAVAGLNKALAEKPDDRGLLIGRAQVYAKGGQAALAAKDYAALRARAGQDPVMLNELCWSQATHGVAFDLALADCEGSLRTAPGNAAVLDSKAFTLLRLGRHAEAIAAYDQALTLRPRAAESLYGRGLAKLGAGRPTEGRADLDAARAIDMRVDAEFAGYGLKAPG